MKFGILTTHRANNFGAVLQAYSLVLRCQEAGADAYVIDYRTPSFERLYYKPIIRRHPIKLIINLVSFYFFEQGARWKFNRFRRLIPLFGLKISRVGLCGLVDKFDAFIAGSDQVWNPLQTADNPEDFDRSYLLDFVRSAFKYSYAASIGQTKITPSSVFSEFAREWKTFDAISVREASGAAIVYEATGKKVPVVVDPVFLHDSTFWRAVAYRRRVVRNKYVVIYDVRSSNYLYDVALKFANQSGCKVVNIVVPALPSSRKKCQNLYIGPREFLRAIDDAEAVFTNSFHASAFSVIFGKKLYVHILENKNTTNSRFDNLLRITGGTFKPYDCLGMETINFIDCEKHINKYQLAEHIKTSEDYLLSILSVSKSKIKQ